MANDFDYYFPVQRIWKRSTGVWDYGRVPMAMHDFKISKNSPEFMDDIYEQQVNKNISHFMSEQVPNGYLFNLVVTEPFPRNWTMDTDYFDESDFCYSIFSKRIKDMVEKHFPKIKGFEWIQAVVRNDVKKKEPEYFYGWVAYIYNYIKCFDERSSEYEEDDDGLWGEMQKLVIDKNHLKNIPLDERLIIMPKETSGFIKLYHKSIVDVISQFDLKEFSFFPLEDYTDNIV